jgi:hypothetical protein
MEYSKEDFSRAADLAKHRRSITAPWQVVASLATLMNPDQVKVSFAQMGRREGGGTEWFVLWASEEHLLIAEAFSADSNDWDASESAHVKATALSARIMAMTELLEVTVKSVDVAWLNTFWRTRETYGVGLRSGSTFSLPPLAQAGAEEDDIRSVVEYLLRHLL